MIVASHCSTNVIGGNYDQHKANSAMKTQLEHIESKVDELVALCNTLNKENKALREQRSEWQQEKKQLLQKNELARSKVEAMIQRLKSMEQA